MSLLRFIHWGMGYQDGDNGLVIDCHDALRPQPPRVLATARRASEALHPEALDLLLCESRPHGDVTVVVGETWDE